MLEPVRDIPVRAGPNTQYPLLMTLAAGSHLDIVGISEDGAWYQTALDGGAFGWVSASAMQVNAYGDLRLIPIALAPTETPSSTPTPTYTLTPTATPSPTPTATLTPTPSPTGQYIVFAGRRADANGDSRIDAEDNAAVYRMRPEGGASELLARGDWDMIDPAISPDGERLSFTDEQGPDSAVYIMSLAHDSAWRLAGGSEAAWSPQGDRLAYVCSSRICLRDAETGESITDNLTGGALVEWRPRWSPDGQYVYFLSRIQDTNGDTVLTACDNARIMCAPATGGGAEPVTSAGVSVADFNFSPDGGAMVLQVVWEDTNVPGARSCRWDDSSEFQMFYLDTGRTVPVLPRHGFSRQPAFSPDGGRWSTSPPLPTSTATA